METEKIKVHENDLIEQLSSIQHEIWSHWMKYMFSCGQYVVGGSFIIPKDKVDRWSKQMNTEYKDLSEKEKQSDRDIVNEFIKR